MLTIKRPTHTTVLYTVSTRPAARTITARLPGYASILLRIAIGLVVATILLQHLFTWTAFHSSSLAKSFQTHVLSTPLGWPAALLPSLLPRPWRLFLSAGVTWLIFRKGYIEESLLVVRGLGVQTSTSSPSWLWSGGSTRFIPSNSIQDIFIYEAFKGFEVKFYLGIVIEGEEDVVVIFPSILPPREILEQVWRGAKACLYEPKS